mmetsp:Transcript_43291/g.94757  ORF Transcript_43291/g.94757 Transcript_43291/m.94757 type:complete len:219 (-) Transcript_43291:1292-1948(-)
MMSQRRRVHQRSRTLLEVRFKPLPPRLQLRLAHDLLRLLLQFLHLSDKLGRWRSDRVHNRPSLEEHAHSIRRTGACGNHQWSAAGFRHHVDVQALCDEQRAHLCRPSGRRRNQRIEPVVIHRVQVSAVREQQADNLHVSQHGRMHQRGHAVGVALVDHSARRNHLLDNRKRAVGRSGHQRSHRRLVFVQSVHISRHGEQLRHHLLLPRRRRHNQRRDG